MHGEGTEEMKRSIVVGGIVGIAIGAIVTFVIAHGLLDFGQHAGVEERRQLPSQVRPVIDSLDDAEDDGHRFERLSARPLRPGSRPRGPAAVTARS